MYPVMTALNRELPHNFLILDRMASSELRPEETHNDGIHFGGTFHNVMADPTMVDQQFAVPFDPSKTQEVRRTQLRRNNSTLKQCCLLLRTLSQFLGEKWNDCTCGIKNIGVGSLNSFWAANGNKFGRMKFISAVVTTHVHQFLNILLAQDQEHS